MAYRPMVRGVLALLALWLSAPLLAAWQPERRQHAYAVLAAEADLNINPGRGYHRWRGQELVPQPALAWEAYQRYQWVDLERAFAVYDFAEILEDLAQAKAQGRRLAFRIRMMTGYDSGDGADLRFVPAYLLEHADCANGCGFWADLDAGSQRVWIPDWNDGFLQQRAAALLQALAAALEGELDALAWIDVGLYGQYGEWTLRSAVYEQAPAGIVAISEASKRALADMHFAAFADVQQVMFALRGNTAALDYGLNQQSITALPVGLRVDCLGRAGFFNQWRDHPEDWALFSGQWQIAPFVAEFCPFQSGDAENNPFHAREQVAEYHISTIGNGNFGASGQSAEQRWLALTAEEREALLALGREAGYRYAVQSLELDLAADGQVALTLDVENLGNAPSYLRWSLRLELLDAGGGVHWSAPLTAELRDFSGDRARQTLTYTGAWPLPKQTGAYTLRLRAAPLTAGIMPPLRWSNDLPQPDGQLTLATVQAAVPDQVFHDGFEDRR